MRKKKKKKIIQHFSKFGGDQTSMPCNRQQSVLSQTGLFRHRHEDTETGPTACTCAQERVCSGWMLSLGRSYPSVTAGGSWQMELWSSLLECGQGTAVTNSSRLKCRRRTCMPYAKAVKEHWATRDWFPLLCSLQTYLYLMEVCVKLPPL